MEIAKLWTRSFDTSFLAARSAAQAGFEPHDGRPRLATRHLSEPCPVIHGLGTEPHGIVVGPASSVHRVRFEQACALFPCVRNGSVQQRPGDALAAMLRGHYEADDRPDRLMVDGLHHGRAAEFGVFLAWAERDPADRIFAAVPDEAWWIAGVDQGSQLGTICLGARGSRRQGPAGAAPA